MRTPSSLSDLYSWWKSALNDQSTPRHDGFPQCGYYKTRLVKQGPWVAVSIFVVREFDSETMELTGPEELRCLVEGLDGGDPSERWPFLTPITREEHDFLLDQRLRDSRMFDARQRIDLSDKPTLPEGVF